MANPSKPALTSVTKPNNATGVTDVPVTPKRKVTYVFQCTSAANVNLPYAVAVNGKVLPDYAKKPLRVSSGVVRKKDKPTVFRPGSFSIHVDAGSKVALYLNSDAATGYRKQPVYEITVGERDVKVSITEKEGKYTDSDKPVLKAPAADAKEAPKIDEYTAPLTGDIWMKVSHKYTAAEVDTLMPTSTSAEVLAAVKNIYSGLKTEELAIAIPAKGNKAAMTLTVTFEDSENPRKNITNYSLLTEGVPRVHPAGYAALFNSAVENSIAALTVTSCWRPMLGSVAHRAGLGLDVNYVGKTRMNRQELRTNAGSGKGNGNDADNVSDAEVKAFKEYEDSIVAKKKASAELEAAKKAMGVKGLSDEDKKKAADRLKAAGEDAKEAGNAHDSALKRWNAERDLVEPTPVKLFRTSLLKCDCVKQLFDPWFMDENTHDQNAPEPNMQRGEKTSNERLHSHHLHITVHEPQIL